MAQYLLALDKEGRTPDLRWLDEEGCAVVHRVAAAGDVPLLEHLLQVGLWVGWSVWIGEAGSFSKTDPVRRKKEDAT